MTIKYFNVKNGLSTGNITLNSSNGNAVAHTFVGNIQVSDLANLGSNANVKITGGTSGQALTTDGAGNLSWTTVSGGGGTPGGSNTQVQYNDGGSFGGSANFTFDETTNTLSVTNITGNGAGLTSLAGANVTGQVGNALVAGTVYTNAQPNITSVGTLSSLAVTGNTTTGNLTVSSTVVLSTGTNLGVVYRNAAGELTTGANLTFNGASLFVSGGVTADDFYGNLRNGSSNIRIAANSNIGLSVDGNSNVAVITSTGLNVAGTINATGIITGNGSGLSSIAGANVTGQVGNALVAGTVYTNAQPNITSLGTLTGLTSNGVVNFTNASNVSLGSISNVKITGGTNGYVLSTDGTGNLSWVAAPTPTSIANGTSNVSIATSGGNVTTSVAGNANILIVTGTGVNVTGTLNATGVITGNGSGLSAIAGANVTGQVGNALVAGTVYTNAQPNITSVGLLTSLSVGPNSSVILTGTSGFVRANAIQGTDGVAALYPAYNGVTGAVGVVSNLVVGAGGSGNLIANVGTAIFGSNANVKITGGTSGQALTTDGAGNLSWTTISGGGGTPGGSNTQIQFNDDGNFAGNAGLVFDKTTTTLTANNFIATSTANLGNVGNVKITGGTNGYVLSTDGTGNLSWIAGGGGGSGANITNNNTANTTYYPVYATATSGSFTVAGISTTKLQFNPSSGQLTVQDLNTLSDATLKSNHEPINDPFTILNQIQGMGFNWKDNGKKSYGVLAQMLEQVLPELVSENAQGNKTVNYIPIIAFLVEAVKQLQSEVEAIKKR